MKSILSWVRLNGFSLARQTFMAVVAFDFIVLAINVVLGLLCRSASINTDRLENLDILLGYYCIIAIELGNPQKRATRYRLFLSISIGVFLGAVLEEMLKTLCMGLA